MSKITENDIELYTVKELEDLGFQFLHGTDIVPDGECQDVVTQWCCSRQVQKITSKAQSQYSC